MAIKGIQNFEAWTCCNHIHNSRETNAPNESHKETKVRKIVCVPTYLHECGTYMINDVAVLNVYSKFVINLVNITLKPRGIQMNIQNPIPAYNVENGDIMQYL